MTDQQQLARGKNIMLSLLDKRLSVPRMYLDADWQGHEVDILAIDRDGSGDVHVVVAYTRPVTGSSMPDVHADQAKLDEALDRLSDIKAQYKYILGVAAKADWRQFDESLMREFSGKTFSPDGLGRIGIALAAPDLNDIMKVDLVIFPERFRAFVGAFADEFVKQHPADWELRA